MTTIKNQEDELVRKDKEIEKLRQTLEHLSGDKPKKAEAPEEKPAKKAAAKPKKKKTTEK